MCEVADESSIIQRLGGRACDEITTMDPHHDRQRSLQRATEVHVQRDEDVEVEAVLAHLCSERLQYTKVGYVFIQKKRLFFMTLDPSIYILVLQEEPKIIPAAQSRSGAELYRVDIRG